MNLASKVFLLCSIPEDQKPINQYISLKENSLLNWSTFSIFQYKQKIVKSFFLIFFFFFTIEFALFFTNFFDCLKLTILFTFFFFLFFIFFTFYRWKEIDNSFSTSRIFYEEESWYDGEIWEKPMSVIKNDKLLGTLKIKPLLKKIKKSLSFFILFS
jgi:hypothetical protein